MLANSSKEFNSQSIIAFQNLIWDFYKNNARAFAWRTDISPYNVVVSEIMLQQTQTHRVEQKYDEFMAALPTFQDLAAASLHDVLSLWQGLGYYRRARYLHQIAQIVVSQYAGQLSNEPAILNTFPGIGDATASSICAFAFNKPTVFIETNIRTVYIHSFFQDQDKVSDKELLPLIEATVDQENPRHWYYALMDYGVALKSQYKNPSQKSLHYSKQSAFEGSDRQIRAHILKLVINEGPLALDKIIEVIDRDSVRIGRIVKQLENEGFMVKNDGVYTIA